MLAQSHNHNSLRARPAWSQPCSTTHSLPARVRPRRAVRHSASAPVAVPGAGSFDDSARGRSIDYPYPPKQRQQQQYLQQPGQQLSSRSGEETDILWAGYR